MSYNTTTLLDNIKRRAAIPSNQSTFTDSEILEIANEAVLHDILPDVLKARQEFFSVWEDLTPTDSDPYPYIRVPERAIGQSIIGIFDPDSDYEISPTSYYIENSKIYMLDESIIPRRVRYYLRPGTLVEVSSCGTISSINRTSGEIGFATLPYTFTSSLTYDLVRGKAGFDLLGKDLTGVVSGNTFTLPVADIPEELQVGDYLCIADTSPVPQIPIEWFSYLAQHTAASILDSLGDFDAAKKIESKLKHMRDNALSLISPRIQKKGKALI